MKIIDVYSKLKKKIKQKMIERKFKSKRIIIDDK